MSSSLKDGPTDEDTEINGPNPAPTPWTKLPRAAAVPRGDRERGALRGVDCLVGGHGAGRERERELGENLLERLNKLLVTRASLLVARSY